MGNFYNFNKELYIATDLTVSENNMTFSRKLVSNIMHNINGYINSNFIQPVIYLSYDLYSILIDDPNFIFNVKDLKEVGKLFGYSIFIDNDLENNQYFLGQEGDIEIIRRKDKINKILSKI